MKYVIDVSKKKARIDKNIYGHFSEHLGRCIYEGIYVGENSPIANIEGIRMDVLKALQDMKLPVLRWPGGCFADEYHWKDGIGPKESRKKMINTHWGGVVEDNSFGTHEFLRLCELIGCEPYITGNVGSGTVREMSEWVEYMTFDGLSPMAKLRESNHKTEPWKLKYFGIGNENWGCGGNMRPEYYSDLYRHFGTYVRNYGDNKIFKIACGPNSDDYNWTDVLMKNAASHMDALTLHYYTLPNDTWEDKGDATRFDEESYYKTLKKTMFMEELITKHSAIMDRYDAQKKIALIVDEWGTWYNVEEGTNPGFLFQQNTMRDALVAGINLNIFNKHADRVRMANIAQLVNVLQAVILTEGDKMLLTPTYHVFEMFAAHQDNELLDSFLATGYTGTDKSSIPDVMESASLDNQGNVIMTLCNTDLQNSKTLEIELIDFIPSLVEGEFISGNMNSYNSFEVPTQVEKKKLEGITYSESKIQVILPPCSVTKMVAKR